MFTVLVLATDILCHSYCSNRLRGYDCDRVRRLVVIDMAGKHPAKMTEPQEQSTC